MIVKRVGPKQHHFPFLQFELYEATLQTDDQSGEYQDSRLGQACQPGEVDVHLRSQMSCLIGITMSTE
jgi:hypothetical protein